MIPRLSVYLLTLELKDPVGLGEFNHLLSEPWSGFIVRLASNFQDRNEFFNTGLGNIISAHLSLAVSRIL